MSTTDTGSNGGRRFSALMHELSQDILSMQQPTEMIMLMQYSLSLYSAIRISVEAGIFRHLAASPSPVSISELVQNLGTKFETTSESDKKRAVLEREEFLTRMLRAVTGLKLADEVGPSLYCANELTSTLAHPGFESGFKEMYDVVLGPQSTMTQTFLWARDNAYKAPATATDGPYQRARGIVGTPTFEHLASHEPGTLSNLSAWMQRIQHDRLNWDSWFPTDAVFGTRESNSTDADDATFMVDVAGGRGHDLTAFAARNPERKMRLVLQEMPEVITEAREQQLDPRIELVEHDFFQPQPINGAHIYFMHKILHDWPDGDCVRILTQLRDAMSPSSRIFINEAIVPDQKSPLQFAAFDLTMLIQLSGKERSESMWTRLISDVGGLAVRKFWHPPKANAEGIVEVVKTA